MVDERLHRALHLGAGRGRHLALAGRDRPLPARLQQLPHALLHDVGGLAHLLHADHLAIVVVAVGAHRDVELHLLVALVGLGLAQVPGGARAAHHHAREAPGPALVERHDADVDVALLEDAVVDEQGIEVVHHLEEGLAEGADILDEPDRQVGVDVVTLSRCDRMRPISQ